MVDALLEGCRALLGEAHVLTSASDLEAYGRDWTRIYQPNPRLIALPASTAEVAKLVRLAAHHGVKVVPSGGRTGLAAGAVAAAGELVISLSRMNQIEQIDSVGQTIRVQAGITTQQVQEAAKSKGLFFPLDLAAKGSCQIGGNIATNAGGVKFIRFGGMREQVIGLEVVLASGEVLDLNTGLRKNNTGYDLKQLFIGSEGTLGIITGATLRLTPPPRNLQVAVMGVAAFADIPRILGVAASAGVQLTACEFFTQVAHEIVLRQTPTARTPFGERYPYYVLLEAEAGIKSDESVIEPLLERLFEANLITDAVIAGTSTEFKELWGLRENITESIAKEGHARKNDISLAIDHLAPFIEDLGPLLAQPADGMTLVLFGHIGDGNLHINYVGDRNEPFAAFQERARRVELKVFELLARYRGSISAEHGIGLLKKKDLHFSRSAAEIAMMRQLKQLLDPAGIMNPGKIFD